MAQGNTGNYGIHGEGGLRVVYRQRLGDLGDQETGRYKVIQGIMGYMEREDLGLSIDSDSGIWGTKKLDGTR